jgi:hypothetical protein
VDTTPAPPLSQPLPPTAGASERAGLRGLPWPVTSVASLEFEVPQVFKLIKTAPAVVAGDGTVLVATPAGTLYGLPNPDVNGASWVAQAPGLPPYNGWIEAGSDNETANSCCYDLLLDQGNNIYSIIIERNLLAGRVYAYRPGGQIPKWPGLPFADLQSDLQLLELYHVSSLEVGAFSAIYVPTFSLLTLEGMAIVNTGTGVTTKISIDAEVPSPYTGYGSATGNAYIDSTNGVAVIASHGNPTGGSAVQGWSMGPSPLWSSSKTNFIASITQSNPNVDPWTKCEGGGRRRESAALRAAGSTSPHIFSFSSPLPAQEHLLYWPVGPQLARALLLRAGHGREPRLSLPGIHQRRQGGRDQ